jgi:hypothetical protein
MACDSWAKVKKKLQLSVEKVEGKGACWLLAVIGQVNAMVPGNKVRSLNIIGREVEFRCRWWLCRVILMGMLEKDSSLCYAGGEQVLHILSKLLQVSVGSSAPTKGFDPTTDGWAGDLCHGLLAQYVAGLEPPATARACRRQIRPNRRRWRPCGAMHCTMHLAHLLACTAAVP